MKRYDSYKDSGVKWIGEIPSHWKVPQAKFLGKIRSGDGLTNKELTDDGLYEVWGGNGLMGFTNKYNISDPKIIIGRVGALCGNIHLSFGKRFITDNALIYSCNSKVNIAFLAYAMDGANLNRLNTSSAQPLITGTKVMNTKFPIPSFSEQRAIVSFLDTELGKIDTYMDKEQQLIERLKELKQSLIARAVTHGIDPKVKMKPSGIDWIGEIPEHWNVKRLGSHFIENRHINSELTVTEAYKFNYGTLIRKDIDVNLKEVEDIYRKYTLLNKNDIVINGLNLNYDFISQRVAKAETKGIITSAYLVLTPRKGVDVNYFCYLFKAMDSQKLFHGMGSGIRLTLSFEDLKSQLLPIPPLSEQHAIVNYLQDKTSKIDKLISEKTREMEYIKELRQRIISDAVTGKIDVRS